MMQVKYKHSAMMVELFREIFCWLPLGHVINKKVLVVHGGLFSRDSVSLDDIREINRNRWVISSSHFRGCPKTVTFPRF